MFTNCPACGMLWDARAGRNGCPVCANEARIDALERMRRVYVSGERGAELHFTVEGTVPHDERRGNAKPYEEPSFLAVSRPMPPPSEAKRGDCVRRTGAGGSGMTGCLGICSKRDGNASWTVVVDVGDGFGDGFTRSWYDAFIEVVALGPEWKEKP